VLPACVAREWPWFPPQRSLSNISLDNSRGEIISSEDIDVNFRHCEECVESTQTGIYSSDTVGLSIQVQSMP
jgi:hypothetical protein